MSDHVLSYYDTLVRQADLETLKPGCWLNDNIIAFALEQRSRSGQSSDSILLLDPAVCQAVKLTQQAASLLAGRHLPLASSWLLLAVVNDSESFDSAGGSHWSLLAMQVAADGIAGCWHCDSSGCHANMRHAAQLSTALHSFVCRRRQCKCQYSPEPLRCPQQQNGCDCGPFTIMFLDSCVSCFRDCDGASLSNQQLEQALLLVDARAVTELRQRLHDSVLQLSAQSAVHK